MPSSLSFSLTRTRFYTVSLGPRVCPPLDNDRLSTLGFSPLDRRCSADNRWYNDSLVEPHGRCMHLVSARLKTRKPTALFSTDSTLPSCCYPFRNDPRFELCRRV